MRIEKLRQLIGWMTDAGLARIEFKTTDFEVRLQRSPGTPAPVAAAPAEAAVVVASTSTSVTSMGCGHFHSRHPARDTPQASPGQAIRIGDVIGVLAVGDLLLPVSAQQDGIAGDYLVADGQLVDYGKPLLALTGTGA